MFLFFFSDGTGHYQDDLTSIHRAQELTERFNLYKNKWRKSCGMTFTDFSKDRKQVYMEVSGRDCEQSVNGFMSLKLDFSHLLILILVKRRWIYKTW